MPILFKAQVRYSPISGIGLFALQDIPKGATWWVFKEDGDWCPCINAPNLPNLIIREDSVKEFLEGKDQKQLSVTLQHTMYYPDGDVILVLREGSGVVNHSFQPNSQVVYNQERDPLKLKSIALREVKAGDEIVEDYSNYPKLSKNWSEVFFRESVPSRLDFQSSFGIKIKQQ